MGLIWWYIGQYDLTLVWRSVLALDNMIIHWFGGLCWLWTIIIIIHWFGGLCLLWTIWSYIGLEVCAFSGQCGHTLVWRSVLALDNMAIHWFGGLCSHWTIWSYIGLELCAFSGHRQQQLEISLILQVSVAPFTLWMKVVWTAGIQMKWRYDHRSCNRNSSNCKF